MSYRSICWLGLWICGTATSVGAELPVREVTVFKDGHALLVRSGKVETNDQGNVALSDLPQPVLGTFWPFADASEPATLRSVSVGTRNVESSQIAGNHAEFIRANVGRQVSITLRPGETIEGKILRVPQGATTFLIETRIGIRLLKLDAVSDITFDEAPRLKVTTTANQQTLELHLDWDGAAPDQASVGMMYLQKGIRWIPGYKIELGDDSTAKLKLQATLVNDLIDLDKADVNLVVGVPSFRFQDTPDPIGGNVTQQLSGFFTTGSQAALQLSNSITTQLPRMGDTRGQVVARQPTTGNDSSEGEGNPGELHLFKLSDVTLRRGDRQVRTIAEWEIPYQEIYKLEIDSYPPPEFQQWRNGRFDVSSALLHSPKVRRHVRLTNNTEAPFTTASALIIDKKKDSPNQDMVLAQSMMTYASVGSRVDLEVTTAVDLQVSRDDRETKRIPDGVMRDGHKYFQVDLASKIRLTNYRKQAMKVEVVRRLIGWVVAASDDGEVTTPLYGDQLKNRPIWWSGYSWPHWWGQLNGNQTTRWEIELPPGETKSVSVDWHYFTR